MIAPSRRRLVGVSTKMYFTPQASKSYFQALAACSASFTNLQIDIFVIPDFTSVSLAQTTLAPQNINVGAQDCHWEDLGAFTGEVSPLALRALGCWCVELGHAERRKWFGETDDMVAKKAAAVARNRMIPLVCIGERNDQGVEAAVDECRPQIESVLVAIPRNSPLIVAYEPVWAIGAAAPAPPKHVLAVTKRLRELAIDKIGHQGEVRILYGGSAGEGTFEELKEGIDGLFLGRFGHDVEAFVRIVEEVAKV